MSKLQAVLFNNKIFNATKARAWLKKNNIKPIKRVDKTKNLLRYRVRSPKQFNKFINKKTSDGIIFTIGFN